LKPIVCFTSTWYEREFGIKDPNPWTSDPDELVEISIRLKKKPYEKFPDLGLGDPDPEPEYQFLQPDARYVCAMAFGADEPKWSEKNSMFWFDRTRPVLKWADTVEKIRSIKMPVWQDQILIRKMIEYNEKVARKTRYPHSKEFIVWHRQINENFIRFAVFFPSLT